MPETPSSEREFNPEIDEQLNLAEATDLTGYGEEFWIDSIKQGEGVIIGHRVGGERLVVSADFSNFDYLENAQQINPEGLEKAFENAGKLREQLEGLDEETRKELYACWQTARICEKLFGKPMGEDQHGATKAKFEAFFREGTRKAIPGESEAHVLKLSQTIDRAACGEYSILAKHILDRLGIDSALVVGAMGEISEDDDTVLGRHSYIVLKDSGLVFDPVQSTHREHCWPPLVLKPEEKMSADSIRDEGKKDKFGKSVLCTDVSTGKQAYYGTGA